MIRMQTRRQTLAALAALSAAPSVVHAKPAKRAPTWLPGDMRLGNPNAPIQVIEYASMSCSHCAHFNEAVFVPFKAKYLDTGKAGYVLKEMLTEPEQVAAAGFLIARCAGPKRYFTVIDQVFRSQSSWQSGSLKPILLRIATANGLTAAQFEACLVDKAQLKALGERVNRSSLNDDVDSTPTIFINGKKVDGVPMSMADMERAIAIALKPGGR